MSFGQKVAKHKAEFFLILKIRPHGIIPEHKNAAGRENKVLGSVS